MILVHRRGKSLRFEDRGRQLIFDFSRLLWVKNMGKRTPLYNKHLDSGAKLVDFSGWDMPIHYGSQIEEHNAVRTDAGVFDVSHMVVIDCSGKDSKTWLQTLLANDVGKLTREGKALYSCLLNEEGKILDDLIVYYLNENNYRIVVNAATGQKDLSWMRQHIGNSDVTLVERDELAIIAAQGPHARHKVNSLFNPGDADQIAELPVFCSIEIDDYFIARTGYTGEDGFEIILPATQAAEFWQSLLDAGIKPCGLGARDTLRLEAGMNLYGADMDESFTPLSSGLDWTVDWGSEERNFIGREALQKQQSDGNIAQFIGLVLEARGVLRPHQKIVCESGVVGEITSGGFSPTLKQSIAMARVKAGSLEHCAVEIRGKKLPVKIVKMPFVRKGKILTTS